QGVSHLPRAHPRPDQCDRRLAVEGEAAALVVAAAGHDVGPASRRVDDLGALARAGLSQGGRELYDPRARVLAEVDRDPAALRLQDEVGAYAATEADEGVDLAHELGQLVVVGTVQIPGHHLERSTRGGQRL